MFGPDADIIITFLLYVLYPRVVVVGVVVVVVVLVEAVVLKQTLC